METRIEGTRRNRTEAKGRRPAWAAAVAALALAQAAWAGPYLIKQRPFTSDFRIEECAWANEDDASTWNPYFPLVPGQQALLEGEEGGTPLAVQITVCDGTAICEGVGGDGTRVVDGVTTRVVEEREWEDGELVEVSRNFFARCVRNGSVFYFGEEVDDYEEGEIVGHGGAWEAGIDGARAGVMMPGLFLLGARYYQEIAPGVALDRAENVRQGVALELEAFADPATGCVVVYETTPLTAGEISVKKYCPGVGLVFDDGIALVEFDQP